MGPNYNCILLRREINGVEISYLERLIIAAGRNWEHEEGGVRRHELQHLFAAINLINKMYADYDLKRTVRYFDSVMYFFDCFLSDVRPIVVSHFVKLYRLL